MINDDLEIDLTVDAANEEFNEVADDDPHGDVYAYVMFYLGRPTNKINLCPT